MRLRGAPIAILLALGFCLAGAAAAQAAEWEIEEAPLSSMGIGAETLTSSGGAFELTVPAVNLTIKCTSESGSGEVLKGGSTGKASLGLSGCVVSKAEKTCSVKSPGEKTGVLKVTATTKFFEKEVKEVEKGYEELTPTGTVEISGAECPFPPKLEMSGATAAEAPKLEEETVKRSQKLSKAIAEESGVTSLKLGKNPAFLIGEVTESLSGSHKGAVLGVTELLIEPGSMIFTVLNGRMGVALRNIGPRKAKITNIEVESGGFMREDPDGCIGRTLDYTEPPFLQECVFTLECTVLPTAGRIKVEWDVLNDNGQLVGFSRRRPWASCGAA